MRSRSISLSVLVFPPIRSVRRVRAPRQTVYITVWRVEGVTEPATRTRQRFGLRTRQLFALPIVDWLCHRLGLGELLEAVVPPFDPVPLGLADGQAGLLNDDRGAHAGPIVRRVEYRPLVAAFGPAFAGRAEFGLALGRNQLRIRRS